MLVATNLELDSIAACVVGGVSLFGGRGTVPGIMIGVLIIGVLANGMNLFGVPPAMQEVSVGSVIIAAVTVESLRKKYR
jgi:ribose/xylose/arabinose/galactoside ABC-type transport system permease subunit